MVMSILFFRSSSLPKITRLRSKLGYANSTPIIPTVIVGTLLISHLFFHGSSTAETIQSAQIASTIVVAKHGPRSFSSIQEAIDSVPHNNNQWIRIHVKPGIYVERVTIPKGKSYIYLEGEVRERTVIESGEYGNVKNSSVFTLRADNFRARNITFKGLALLLGSPRTLTMLSKTNFMIHGVRSSEHRQLCYGGDKASFYDCSFISMQDTLSDMQGRHYFESCYIEGTIDFIWGYAKSQYFNCIIFSKSASLMKQPGFVTAQGRREASDTSAFVFIAGTVKGSGSTYLGRAYRSYSTVIFYKTYLSTVVTPLGWDAWNYKGKENTITYVEEGCTGLGSNKSGRVKWMKSMSPEVYDAYINTNNFINQDRWLQNQPYN